MNPKIGDLVVMRDESSIHGMMGVVIAEETDLRYVWVWVNGKMIPLGEDDVEMIVQHEQNSYSTNVQ